MHLLPQRAELLEECTRLLNAVVTRKQTEYSMVQNLLKQAIDELLNDPSSGIISGGKSTEETKLPACEK